MTVDRKCDSKNLNMSPLCYLNGDMVPPLWQEEVVNTYKMVNNESLPDYVKVLLDIILFKAYCLNAINTTCRLYIYSICMDHSIFEN